MRETARFILSSHFFHINPVDCKTTLPTPPVHATSCCIRRQTATWLAALLLASIFLPRETQAAADLYIKDTPADVGVEPNPDTGPMWISDDIWVRQNPFPGYLPYAFSSDPAWLTAVSPLHENPEYRDPKYSKPNYIYVRVRNRGSSASSGTERLRVYWAKASTGLG